MKIEYNKRKVLDKIYVYDLLFKKVSGYQVFNKDLMKKMLSTTYSGLQDLVVTFTVTYSNDNWHVNLVDVHE